MADKMISRRDFPMQPGKNAEQSRATPAPIDGGVISRPADTTMSTLFTSDIDNTTQFLSAPDWIRVTLELETAGPVAIGTTQDIRPVLSGKGRLLTTNVPFTFVMTRGSRLYYAANAINRVSMTVESIPYGNALIELVAGARNNVGRLASAIVNLVIRK